MNRTSRYIVEVYKAKKSPNIILLLSSSCSTDCLLPLIDEGRIFVLFPSMSTSFEDENKPLTNHTY